MDLLTKRTIDTFNKEQLFKILAVFFVNYVVLILH